MKKAIEWRKFMPMFALALTCYVMVRAYPYLSRPYFFWDAAIDIVGLLALLVINIYVHKLSQDGNIAFMSRIDIQESDSTSQQVIISCPECQTVQKAAIVFDDRHPWPIYVHDCIGCGYTIMESEWNEVKE